MLLRKMGTRKKVWPPSDASVEIQRQIKHESSPLRNYNPEVVVSYNSDIKKSKQRIALVKVCCVFLF